MPTSLKDLKNIVSLPKILNKLYAEAQNLLYDILMR